MRHLSSLPCLTYLRHALWPYAGGMTFLVFVDVLLLLGLTLRLTRLVVTDDIGEWWIKYPAKRWTSDLTKPQRHWLRKYADGLDCPFCVGFHIGWLCLLSLALVGGPGAEGIAAVVWRYVAGAFALNWVAAHIGARMGDAGYDED